MCFSEFKPFELRCRYSCAGERQVHQLCFEDCDLPERGAQDLFSLSILALCYRSNGGRFDFHCTVLAGLEGDKHKGWHWSILLRVNPEGAALGEAFKPRLRTVIAG
jgi:hypothetical protein